ncbi:hypothetical protein CRYUN_Cryun01aG0117100 [Craigia yunnanensis]
MDSFGSEESKASLNLKATERLPGSQSFEINPELCLLSSAQLDGKSFFLCILQVKTSISAKVNKGSAPPSFTLKDHDGKNVSLSKFKGKPVVVYFYPADESPNCTKQACAFRDPYEKFTQAGAEVIGISGDDTSSHKAFAKKYRLPFTLQSDDGNKVGKEWGVPANLLALPGELEPFADKASLWLPLTI